MRPLLLAALVALALPARSTAQIAPGPLSRAHASLEGTLKCTQCHGRAREAMPRLCLSCHREVGTLINQRRGLHVREELIAGKTCSSCHPEHAGRDFDLVEWPGGSEKKFDHRAAGWSLEGEHKALECSQCHRREYRTPVLATLSPRKTTAGWVGLDPSCNSCHESDDPHDGSLGNRCDQCHDAEAWAPALGFDHDSSRYALTGAHADVRCEACHDAPQPGATPRADGSRVPLYRPVSHAECSNCHRDPHAGRLSAKCSECHVTRGFDVLDRRGFNHGLTRYPLVGKHRVTSCDACHGRGMANARPAFATCATCHVDRHGGEAVIAGKPADCSACHGVSGFVPATFTLAQHRETAFPLGGKHQAVRCALCHTQDSARPDSLATIRLRLAVSGCASCHDTPHGDQLAGSRCEQCHSDRGWTELGYDPEAHAGTRLPLEGRHAQVSCTACHGPVRPGLPRVAALATTGTAGVVFELTEVQCAACHADPHPSEAGATDSTRNCGDCHGADGFRPARVGLEAHAGFRFALEGAHRAVACLECHTGFDPSPKVRHPGASLVGASPPPAAVRLASVRGTTCAACHATPHGSQFAARADSGRCDACHVSDRFQDLSRFDHASDAAFALTGAHEKVACASCHPGETVGDTVRVVYRGVTRACEDCHRGGRQP